MGVSIDPWINPNGVSTMQWEAVHQESLSLLRRFPVPLRRLGPEEIASTERYVYTRELVNNEGTEDEYWAVCGRLPPLSPPGALLAVFLRRRLVEG